MGLVVYDINNYLKDSLTGDFANIDIHPLVGYSETSPPFMLYHWLPSKRNIERFYIRRDFIIYNMYDNDADRLFRLSEEMEQLLNLADGIQGKVESNSNRVLWSEWRGGTPSAPSVREGFYKMSFEVWIGYVPLS